MPTPFVTTTFAVLTMLNNAGQLAPVDKALLPAGINGPIQFNAEACAMLRGRMENPEKYVCQVFTSPAEINLTYQAPGFVKDVETSRPERKSEAGPVIVGPTRLTAADRPYIEPLAEVAKPEPPKEPAAPKKVAQRPRQERHQAMFVTSDPLNAVASLFRDW
jgi:hypothetical protein